MLCRNMNSLRFRTLILLLVLPVLLVMILNIDAAAFERRLLAEIFTNSYCPLCPRYIPLAQDALEDSFEPEDYVFIQYHTWWPGNSDPWYWENYERHLPEDDDIVTRITWMDYDQFMGVPSFFFDGYRIRYSNSLGDEVTDYVSERLGEDSPLRIEIVAEVDDNTLLTSIVIRSEQNLANLTLFLALCEREVEYDAQSGQRRFTGNVLDLYPDGNGVRFSIVSDFDWSYQCESPWDIGWHDNDREDLFVAAWVQRQDLEILQSQDSDIQIYNKIEREQVNVHSSFTLEPAYPNPFNSRLEIPFRIDQPGNIAITVHDLTGREILRLTDAEFASGRHTLSLNADESGLTNGIYFLKMIFNGRLSIQKIAYLR
ncbi:T9SS type A sorting domain-containing protein [bacterium]|nr:T9SS type A sorting domain-containing protein [bacterium]